VLMHVCLCSTESGCRFGANCRFDHISGDVPVADNVTDGSECEAGVDGVETAMAGLSVVDQSSNSSLSVTAAHGLPPRGADVLASTDNRESASTTAAAAATKCSRKKKKSTKKGARKMKQESKSKELVLYDHQTVKCGTFSFWCNILCIYFVTTC